MFDRVLYKSVAKQQLSKRWAVAVIATLVTLFVTGAVEAAINKIPNQDGSVLYAVLSLSYLCIQGVFNIANANLYLIMSKTRNGVGFDNYTEGFNKWLCGIRVTLYSSFWIFLWTCLFIIPGIVKSIAYSLATFVVAEAPDMKASRALRISIILTSGHKMEMFVAFLSFIPWMLLSILTFGIGLFWLCPYMSMTWVNIYHDLKRQALQQGLLTQEDFA